MQNTKGRGKKKAMKATTVGRDSVAFGEAKILQTRAIQKGNGELTQPIASHALPWGPPRDSARITQEMGNTAVTTGGNQDRVMG